jgi:hypothetical protein
MADINQSMFQWNTQVETMKKNFAMDPCKDAGVSEPDHRYWFIAQPDLHSWD